MIIRKVSKAYVAGLLLLLSLGAFTHVRAQVHSLNAIGILQIPLSVDVARMATVQLVPQGCTGTTYTVAQVLGTNSIPASTMVYLMGSDQQVYQAESFDGSAWTPGTNLLVRGQGFWIKAPTNCTLKMVGNVPDSTAATTTVAVTEGIQMMGCPYPVRGSFTNGMINTVSHGDVVMQLTGDGQVSTNIPAMSYYEGTGWSQNNVDFEIGDAWFYRSMTNKVWTTTKPYEYP